jgi:WhiB family transcriptional regulator, redox-sensing transcriptional regulator
MSTRPTLSAPASRLSLDAWTDLDQADLDGPDLYNAELCEAGSYTVDVEWADLDTDHDADLVDWRSGAACGADSVEIFFPSEVVDSQDQHRREAEAKEICAGCPVRLQCLLSAVIAGERHGVWGGLTPTERRSTGVGPLPLPAAA